jgi:(R,R)-butanediol dehydrogenase/meso-butanediol dehydrogenase/diacetyl reductase
VFGAVFRGNREVELREFPDPTPRPREVVVKVESSGMCGSDLHLYRQPPGPSGYPSLAPGASGPVIAGHEPCGVVAARGSAVGDAQAPIGARVIVFHYAGCGRCGRCWSGWPQLCELGSVGYGGTAHGGHAEYIVVPAETLVPLPDEMSFDVGACIACGTGTAFGALKRLGLAGGETVAIVGQGPVGLSATLLATAMGATVVAIDVEDAPLERAAQAGASVVLNALDTDVVDEIRTRTRGRGCAGALETSGASDGRLAAIRSVRVGGTVVLVGLGGEQLTLDVDGELVMTPRTLIGSRTFSIAEMAECVEFVVDRGVPIERIVTGRYPLRDADRAYRRFDEEREGKLVLAP